MEERADEFRHEAIAWYLIADERTFTLPIGFSERLRARLESEREKTEAASHTSW
jgi:hypothetical protein